MPYFLIQNTEDGIRVRQMNIADLQDGLAEGDIDTDFFKAGERVDSDPYYWPKSLLIKGEAVVPMPVQVATKYEIP